MKNQPTRRAMLQSSCALGGALLLGGSLRAEEAPAFEELSVRTISPQTDLYHGWPTLAQRKNGELMVVWSGGREAHVCPFGRVEMMRSDDEGKTWSWPRVLSDSAIDDRDAGIVETSKGTLLVTTFTSLAFEPGLKAAESGSAKWDKSKLDRWLAARDRIPEAERKKQLGVWMLRSEDNGVSWSAPYRCQVNSPHGPIQLSDGRLLYAGKELWQGKRRVGVCESKDDGKTWQWLADIPVRKGDTHANYHELHAVEAGEGKLIVHIRNHNQANHRETLQCESTDGGKTWTTPHPIGVWGLPSHLTKLSDGRLLMSYGHRRKPLGVQARISSDEGKTWSAPVVIYGKGISGDLGYPSTVQLKDGSLLTVWYEYMAEPRKAMLRQMHWKLKA